MKYDIRICMCGRIHAIPNEKIHSAIKSNKELVMICGGCGAITFIGADYCPKGAYGFDEPCYDMYSYGIQESFSIDSNFTNPKGRPLAEVLVDVGLKVPMMTGEYARQYTHYAGFSDIWSPDFYAIEHKGVTAEEVKDFIDKYRANRKIVNMSQFIYENRDKKDILKELSTRCIEGLNWERTEFDPNKSAKETSCFK